MATIRIIEIENFRAIKSLRWLPGQGCNCLIGPGDRGKSTVLDAIDLCLGARRSVTFTDADFHAIDFKSPIRIALTLGALDEPLKNIDAYGEFLVGFDRTAGKLEPEPGSGLEPALTIQLSVASDLEPEWTLVSPRAIAAGRTRNLNWTDRARIAPARLGSANESNLTWRRGSVLNKLSEERANASQEFANAARELREAFDEKESKELEAPLKQIAEVAEKLGVPVGGEVRALIDAGSVTFTGGTISLHDKDGVPLGGLGLGSMRLLIAGLQRKASQRSTMVLVDELEHGLEPHRIIRFLGALGAKEAQPPLQVFMTSHSPVAVAELSAEQLFIVRRKGGQHEIYRSSDAGDVQGTIRAHPHALLASSIVVCEGASEIGLMRGLDQYFTSKNDVSLAANGTALVNGNGDETFARARALQSLGYLRGRSRPTIDIDGFNWFDPYQKKIFRRILKTIQDRMLQNGITSVDLDSDPVASRLNFATWGTMRRLVRLLAHAERLAAKTEAREIDEDVLAAAYQAFANQERDDVPPRINPFAKGQGTPAQWNPLKCDG